MSILGAPATPCIEPRGSPIHSIGASSRSPSPMATRPSKGTVSKTARMASTAAPSAALRSPRPLQAEAATAAASVACRKCSARSMVAMMSRASLSIQ